MSLQSYLSRIKPILAVISITAALVSGMAYGTVVRADQFDEQIRALQQQNSANRAISNQMGAEARSYQDQVNKLRASPLIGFNAGNEVDLVHNQLSIGIQVGARYIPLNDHMIGVHAGLALTARM